MSSASRLLSKLRKMTMSKSSIYESTKFVAGHDGPPSEAISVVIQLMREAGTGTKRIPYLYLLDSVAQYARRKNKLEVADAVLRAASTAVALMMLASLGGDKKGEEALEKVLNVWRRSNTFPAQAIAEAVMAASTSSAPAPPPLAPHSPPGPPPPSSTASVSLATVSSLPIAPQHGAAAAAAPPASPGKDEQPDRRSYNGVVVVWDLDEAVLPLASMACGEYARVHGASLQDGQDIQGSVEDAIFKLLDEHMFFAEIEEVDSALAHAYELAQHDDHASLSTYDFKRDGGVAGASAHSVVAGTAPADVMRKLAYRYRRLRAYYNKRTARPFDTSPGSELDGFVTLVNAYTRGWLHDTLQTLAILVNKHNAVLACVTGSQLSEAMAKCMVFGVDAHVPMDLLYSAKSRGRGQCLRDIVARFGPHAHVVYVAHAPTEADAAAGAGAHFQHLDGGEDLPLVVKHVEAAAGRMMTSAAQPYAQQPLPQLPQHQLPMYAPAPYAVAQPSPSQPVPSIPQGVSLFQSPDAPPLPPPSTSLLPTPSSSAAAYPPASSSSALLPQPPAAHPPPSSTVDAAAVATPAYYPTAPEGAPGGHADYPGSNNSSMPPHSMYPPPPPLSQQQQYPPHMHPPSPHGYPPFPPQGYPFPPPPPPSQYSHHHPHSYPPHDAPGAGYSGGPPLPPSQFPPFHGSGSGSGGGSGDPWMHQPPPPPHMQSPHQQPPPPSHMHGSGGGGGGMPPPRGALKTRLCKFFEQGSCRRGQFCGYAHGEAELRSGGGGGGFRDNVMDNGDRRFPPGQNAGFRDNMQAPRQQPPPYQSQAPPPQSQPPSSGGGGSGGMSYGDRLAALSGGPSSSSGSASSGGAPGGIALTAADTHDFTSSTAAERKPPKRSRWGDIADDEPAAATPSPAATPSASATGAVPSPKAAAPVAVAAASFNPSATTPPAASPSAPPAEMYNPLEAAASSSYPVPPQHFQPPQGYFQPPPPPLHHGMPMPPMPVQAPSHHSLGGFLPQPPAPAPAPAAAAPSAWGMYGL